MRAFALRAAAAVMFTAGARHADAQLVQANGLSPFVKDYKVDFAVPDAPAFKLLHVDESAILRPQTVREMTLALDGLTGSNNALVVPRQFGVEVSPGLLVGSGRLELTSYQAKKFLYATRLSGATGRDSLNRGQVAGGIRFSIVDEQDLRNRGASGSDTVVTRMTQSMLDIYLAARLRAGRPPAALVLTDAETTALKAIGDSITSYWADRYWNATSLDVAFGARARTADSLGHSPTTDRLAGWVTYATGLQDWGQLLLGATLGAARDSLGKLKSLNAVAARLYVGSNGLKAFVEAQQSLAAKAEARWLLNSGVEARVPNVGWVDASAGYAAAPPGGRARLISTFKFKAAR